MGAKKRTITMPDGQIVTISKTLNKYANKVLFPKQVENMNRLLKNAILPER